MEQTINTLPLPPKGRPSGGLFLFLFGGIGKKLYLCSEEKQP